MRPLPSPNFRVCVRTLRSATATALPCRVDAAVTQLASQSVHISEGVNISGQPTHDR